MRLASQRARELGIELGWTDRFTLARRSPPDTALTRAAVNRRVAEMAGPTCSRRAGLRNPPRMI
jgi:hypothetical protein